MSNAPRTYRRPVLARGRIEWTHSPSALPRALAAPLTEGAASHDVNAEFRTDRPAPVSRARISRVSAAAERWRRAHKLIAEQPGPDRRPGNVADALRRICGAGAVALAASGVGVSVLTDEGIPGFSVASDRGSQYLEELQFTLGEGPCMEVIATSRPVLVAEVVASAERWPAYAAAVLERGIRSVFAFPLQAGAAKLGVLDVFRAQAGELTRDEVAHSLTFAEIARVTLLDGQDRTSDGALPDGFADTLGYRAEVFQAQGMVMVQLGVSLTQALARMRAYAYAEGRPLADVARDIVARTLQLECDEP